MSRMGQNVEAGPLASGEEPFLGPLLCSQPASEWERPGLEPTRWAVDMSLGMLPALRGQCPFLHRLPPSGQWWRIRDCGCRRVIESRSGQGTHRCKSELGRQASRAGNRVKGFTYQTFRLLSVMGVTPLPLSGSRVSPQGCSAGSEPAIENNLGCCSRYSGPGCLLPPLTHRDAQDP